MKLNRYYQETISFLTNSTLLITNLYILLGSQKNTSGEFFDFNTIDSAYYISMMVEKAA